MAVAAPITPAPSLGSNDLDALVFEQELYEVYILLDFISGRPDKHLFGLDNKFLDADDASRKLSSSAVIERVSKLRFPPTLNYIQRGRDAAFLLTLKDELNSMAYPARGSSIAYTIMFTEPGGDSGTNRLQAARRAFPNLVTSASRFRLMKNMLSWTGLIVTFVATLSLWQVTYGAQLAARFDEAKRNDTQSAAQVYEELDKGTSVPEHDVAKACRLGPEDPDKLEDRSSSLQQVCNEYAYRHALLCIAIADVGRYSQSWIFHIPRWLLPIHRIQPIGACGNQTIPGNKGRQEDAQSIAGVLAVMSNYLLPILFGLVGTIAALVRGIQDKVTESILSPRDRALSLIRLPLGMVAGACVGLFFTPSHVATETAGSIGTFTVSASGIAFLAGYGSEGFFRALDALVVHLFSLDKDTHSRK